MSFLWLLLGPLTFQVVAKFMNIFFYLVKILQFVYCWFLLEDKLSPRKKIETFVGLDKKKNSDFALKFLSVLFPR